MQSESGEVVRNEIYLKESSARCDGTDRDGEMGETAGARDSGKNRSRTSGEWSCHCIIASKFVFFLVQSCLLSKVLIQY